jgi:hypothetical protein
MADNSIKITKDKATYVLSAIKNLENAAVYVGFPAASDTRLGLNPGKDARDAGPKGTAGPSNALIAYWMENGTEHIPPRPFLKPGIKAAQKKISMWLERAGQASLDGKPEMVMKSLMAAGLVAQSSVRAKIVEGPFVPLAKSTLAARRRAGFMGTKPLLRSGQLRQAVSFVIRTKR